MAAATESPYLVTVLRQPPTLEPCDSVSRAIDMLRYAGMGTLPVVDGHGAFCGVVSLNELRPLLNGGSLTGPASDWVRQPGAIGRSAMSVEEVRRVLAESGETALVILDSRNRYVGMVGLDDLLAPLPVRPRPAMIGGMATPWGVYLTSGGIQAGVGNLALVGNGVLLGILLAASMEGIGLVSWVVQKVSGLPLYALYSGPDPERITVGNMGWLLLRAMALPVFLLILRSLPLSRYHAAEHQAVHAMERGEPLVPEIVARMPRVHPRCGTNIMAGGMVFLLISQIPSAFSLGWLDAANAAVLGAITALFTWRSIGAFLQDHFTTQPARRRHLESGIAAAEELERRFMQAPPERPRFLRRLWCMGIFQTFIGVSLGSPVAFFLFERMFVYLR